MGKSGNTKAEHVRSAKKWLEKAEQSFDSQSDIRGELNLMLAEAEMKNLRKNHGAGLRSKGKFAVMAGLLVVSAGAWFALTHSREAPVMPPAPPERVAAETAPVPKSTGPQQGEEAAGSVQADLVSSGGSEWTDLSISSSEGAGQAQDEAPAPSVQQSAPAAQPVLTETQIQQAVRAARHSLRGTETMNK